MSEAGTRIGNERVGVDSVVGEPRSRRRKVVTNDFKYIVTFSLLRRKPNPKADAKGPRNDRESGVVLEETAPP